MRHAERIRGRCTSPNPGAEARQFEPARPGRGPGGDEQPCSSVISAFGQNMRIVILHFSSGLQRRRRPNGGRRQRVGEIARCVRPGSASLVACWLGVGDS